MKELFLRRNHQGLIMGFSAGERISIVLFRVGVPGIIMMAALAGCTRPSSLSTFASFPGFEKYYGRCEETSGQKPGAEERFLLYKFQPRIVLAPGALWPIDFYRDYLSHAVIRDADRAGRIVAEQVTRKVLKEKGRESHLYLDLVHTPDLRQEGKRPVVYGRVYRENVSFSDGKSKTDTRRFTFLKYSVVFALSGLPAGLPWTYDRLLRLLGVNPEDWHELDNFCAVHVVLDETEKPVAVILAQHNHHRTYLVGKDIPLPEDKRMVFCAAKRSNELYPDRGESEQVFHRTIPFPIYTEYLLSGEEGPWLTADDVTYGQRAGGEEVDYDLQFLDACDPFYTSRLMLGEYRPFFGLDLGRNGPPGADYYTFPSLIPLGNLLRASYLHDGDREDIQMVKEAIDRRVEQYDVSRLLRHGGQKFYRDWLSVQAGKNREGDWQR